MDLLLCTYNKKTVKGEDVMAEYGFRFMHTKTNSKVKENKTKYRIFETGTFIILPNS